MAQNDAALRKVRQTPLKYDWDEGVFSSELFNQSIVPRNITTEDTNKITPPKDAGKPAPLKTGTYLGTKLALTQMSKRVERRFESFFDAAGFESSIPLSLSTEEARKLYTFNKPGSDNYPPHLDIVPKVDQVSLLQIFDFMRLLDTGTVLATLIPDKILDFSHDHPEGATIDAIEARNVELFREKKDIFTEENIGHRADWWTDAVFAQQQFIGPNPTTIETASPTWVKQFAEAAQSNQEMYHFLSSPKPGSLYVQDCSYFREAIGVSAQADMISTDGRRFNCAAVTLFSFSEQGVLHPLAIVLDYKGSMRDSVVVFNKRVSPSSAVPEAKDDWAWRYAKTCAQVSDWLRHEMSVHLVETHFVEEATIVATHRAFSTDHPVYRLLQPHWLKTLSIGAAARSGLVPNIVAKLVGITEPQLYTFLRDAYRRFDWTGHYVPANLDKRGFPAAHLADGSKFHNYTYGRNMNLMWQILRKFVSAVIAIDFHSDEDVAKDEQIAAWSAEMQSDTGAQKTSFPEIKTIDALVDAVTMCIHIASPQHTAVNYLQGYYQEFVINKPPALSAPLPKTLAELNAYTEEELVAAFPVKKPREWLLASHVPYLLSYRVAEDQNLINFALSASKLALQNGQTAFAGAAAQLYADLLDVAEVFKKNSLQMDDQTKPYAVMDPDKTAVSILL